MTFNANMIKNIISASLHQTYYESAPFKTYEEMYDTAVAIRNCLSPLYPITEAEWDAVVSVLDSCRYLISTDEIFVWDNAFGGDSISELAENDISDEEFAALMEQSGIVNE